MYVHVFWDWVFLEGFVLVFFGLWKKLLGGFLLGGFKLKARLWGGSLRPSYFNMVIRQCDVEARKKRPEASCASL